MLDGLDIKAKHANSFMPNHSYTIANFVFTKYIISGLSIMFGRRLTIHLTCCSNYSGRLTIWAGDYKPAVTTTGQNTV